MASLRVMWIFIVFIASLLIIGCVKEDTDSNASDEGNNISELARKSSVKLENVKIYYYYDPACPNCEAVEPYIQFLAERSPVSFDFCDVTEINNCSDDSKMMISLASKKLNNSLGVPMAIILNDSQAFIFLGRLKITKIDTFLEKKLNVPSPEIRFGSRFIKLNECIACHEQMGLTVPSVYTCTYCCHDVDVNISDSRDIEFKME